MREIEAGLQGPAFFAAEYIQNFNIQGAISSVDRAQVSGNAPDLCFFFNIQENNRPFSSRVAITIHH